MNIEELASECTPTALGGVGTHKFDAPVADGGICGFPVPHDSAWDCIAGQSDTLSDLREFLDEMEQNNFTRSAAVLRSLDRMRDQLERVPCSAALGDPVALRLQDVALIARYVMQRLR